MPETTSTFIDNIHYMVHEVPTVKMRSPMAELKRRANASIARLQDTDREGSVAMREEAADTMRALLEVVTAMEPLLPVNQTDDDDGD